MRLFIDTNVMIDIIDTREPFYIDAAKLIVLAERGQVQITASSLSYVNTFYVLEKTHPKDILKETLKKFRIICNVAEIDELNIDKSLYSSFNDFEDAVQYHSAIHSESDIFITRNKKDFKKSEIPVMTPIEFLASIKSK
ncbi:type II toxin-antitoxin system VapC family toxin [Flavobacterium psychrotrophum]|uniref:type II toxin-antitoxin system VapC family toxin n=1 Tax=Flavobacterium psychrotrophum TaxID=2294119 RepID=UPI000E3213DC|nr:PIN domain-containing protein [Flavobacterium psychrotrophum]